MSHFIPAAPNTLALIAYAGKDDHVGVAVHAVFAFEIKDGAKRPLCFPVGVSEITVGRGQILGIQMPDGSVAKEDRVFDSSVDFIRNCDDLFGLPPKRKAKSHAEFVAREKKIAERKAAEDLL